ncbi:peptidylprolyl isomerase [Candidatus Saganbacteria bacterium]|nr:peptidylprolyl isomerase [Candidatus Saganbacteria bacterium]
MLTWLRKNMKGIMLTVAILFIASMFYGLGYSGIKQMGGGEGKKGFVKVNGREVDVHRFNQIFQRLRDNFPQTLKPSEALFIQNLALSQTIDFAVMLEEARQKERVSGSELNGVLEQIAKSQKFSSVNALKDALNKQGGNWDEFKNLVRDDLLVQKMMQKIKSSATVSTNDMREVRARHILIRPQPGKEQAAEKQINDILSRVRKGEDFAALAGKYSEDPGSKTKGGDLGFFGTGIMYKPFEDLAFGTKVGEIGGPVKTEAGWHIIKVDDSRIKKFEGGKDPQKTILAEKQERAFREWFYGLKQKAKVEIEDPALKALDLRFKGNLGSAVVEYQKAIRQDPRNGYLHLFLGDLYEQSNKVPEAVFEYKEAIKVSPADPSLYLILGQAYLKMDQDQLALDSFKKASAVAGDNKEMHEGLLKTFKDLKIYTLVREENEALSRIARKETFMKSLGQKEKLKTE